MDLTTVDKLLTTTRTVRRRLDLTRAVPRAVIEECLDIAIQAPTGGNSQGWHFVVVTEPDLKAQIGELYKQSFAIYARSSLEQAATSGQNEAYQAQRGRVAKSAVYLAGHMGEVPLMVIPCIHGRLCRPQPAGPIRPLWLYPARGVVVHAGPARARPGRGLDDAAFTL